MESLSDRLRALGVRVGETRQRPPRRSFPIEGLFSGTIEETIHGTAFFVESRYPAGSSHGHGVLQLEQPMEKLGLWAGLAGLESTGREALVFLDTETTGLAGGAGTFAFMVGVGRFAADDFVLRQYFLRDPAEELAMLAALEAFLDDGPYLVTFNGKSFDLPLLQSRWISNGWEEPWSPYDHIDLLHLARRIWRESLPSRALGQLETHILGLERSEEEVPGWLIPQMYTDYLYSGDARPMAGVFYHNAMDMLSMVALLDHAAGLLHDPSNGEATAPLERYAIACIYEDLGLVQEAAGLYQSCLEEAVPREYFLSAIRRLSFLEKRRKNYSEAVSWWRQAAEEGEIYAFVELAKYFEHTAVNLEAARKWTNRAIDTIGGSDQLRLEQAEWQAELEHRHRRLTRKIEKERSNP